MDKIDSFGTLMGQLGNQIYSILCSVVAHFAVFGAVLSYGSFGPKVNAALEIHMVSLAPVLEEKAALAKGDANSLAPSVPSEAPPEVKPEPVIVEKKVQTKPVAAKKLSVKKPIESPRASPAQTSPANQSAPKSPGLTTPDRTLPGQGGQEVGGGAYDHLILSQLVSAKRYPERARRRRVEGALVVAFAIDRQGQVINTFLARPSESDMLNQAALEMVARAAPFPPPPQNYRPGQPIEFSVPVQFSLH